MDGDPADVCVIEVEIPDGCAIGEGRHVSRRLSMSANDRRRAAHGKRELPADANRPLVPSAYAAANRINHMRLDTLDGCGVEVLVAQAVSVVPEPFSERSLSRLGPGRGPVILRICGVKNKRQGACTGADLEKSPTRNFHCIAPRSKSRATSHLVMRHLGRTRSLTRRSFEPKLQTSP